MNFLRGFSLNAASTGLVFALGLLNQSLLNNALSDEDFGRLRWWGTTALLGALVFGEWLNKGNAYVAGKGAARQKLAGNTLAYALFLGLVLMGGALAAVAGSWLPRSETPYWVLLAGLVAVLVLQKGVDAIFLGRDQLKPYSLLPVLFICCYLGGNLAVLKARAGGLDEVLAVWVGSAGLVTLAGLWLLRRGQPLGADQQLWRQVRGVGGRGGISVILVFLLFRSDQYLVEHLLGAASLGVYSVAVIFAEMMQRLPNVAGAVLMPKVIQAQEGEGWLSLRVARNVLLFSLCCAVGLLLAGQLLIALFFPRSPEAFAPLLWMLPGLVVAGFGSVFNTRLAGQGYPPITLWTPALALGLNVALNLALIPVLGLVGAALSTSLAYGLWGGLTAHHCLRQLGCGWGAFLRGVGSLPSIYRS
ncbi:MAG: polysaccharide biosynthesis C-terminal domain-containing protein [Candidatus Latescibacteria bacterium]|nr:polysaccharide biosynthesis C-terminal domain-containing protein [Candidatus Latescibacterota bacterium]